MTTCLHHGEGCSPPGGPMYKCSGYYEHSFVCENYVCENHVRRSRYGTFCEQCYPSPPVFASPKGVKRAELVVSMAITALAKQRPAQHR